MAFHLFGGSRHKQISTHPGNPQYFVGVAPGNEPAMPTGSHNSNIRFRKSKTGAVVTSGFNDDMEQGWSLHYGLRVQPDIGGALNFAYENYGLPLDNVCGAWMVARNPTMPIGSRPLAFFQNAPITGIGGLIPGQIIAQPLLDPDSPGSGYDIYS